MFRPARWRTDKTKTKAVFKLQFHATQVSQLRADSLMLSVVPGDTGKPTVRLEKAVLSNGCCKWETPVYETVKFTRDPKTGKVHEKIYHFILSAGSGKSAIIGEVSLDFADYAEEIKACSVSLPIKSSNNKSLLNVLIHRLQDSVDHREIEENEEFRVKSQDRSLRSQFSNSDREDSINSTSTEDAALLNQTIRKVVANGNFSTSSGSDLTTSSESSSGLNTPRENGSRMQRDPNSFLSYLSSISSPLEPISDGAIVVYNGKENSEVAPTSELDKLRSKLNLSELELQTLRKQIVKESKRANELSREVTSLKEERDSLEEENERLRAVKERKNGLQYEGGDFQELLEELRQELDYEKNVSINLRLQLKKTQESNDELVLAVRDLEEMLDRKSKEVSDLRGKLVIFDEDDEEQRALEAIVKGQREAKETYVLEQRILDLNGEIEMYRRDRDEFEVQMEQLALDYEILKQKHHEVVCKFEQSRIQEQLKLQYECCGSGYEKEYESRIEKLESEMKKLSEELEYSTETIIELTSKVERSESELRKRSEECSELERKLSEKSEELSGSLASVRLLEAQVKGLEEELEIRARDFERELGIVTRAKVEQEKRAISAEEALRKMKWKNFDTADRLQEEFRKLSAQMASTFESNERVAIKAVREAAELRKDNERLKLVRNEYEAKVGDISRELREKSEKLEKGDAERREMSRCIELLKVELEEKDVKVRDLEKGFESMKIRFGETERLRKELSELKEELQKRDCEISSTENRLVEANMRNDNEVADLREKIRSLECEIKEKESSYLEKERDFKARINELKRQLEELDFGNAELGKKSSQKDANSSEGFTSEHVHLREIMTTEDEGKSKHEDLSTELSFLKERNTSMGIELKELQDKYSDLSLRFAEVEGERQKLVMTVRYLKNAKKR